MSVTQDELNVAIQDLKKMIDDFGPKIAAWATGPAGGGPNNDGIYPLPAGLLTTVSAPSPAQMAVNANKLVSAGPSTGAIQLGLTPGFTGSSNSYTFKESDNGKVFVMMGGTATTAVTLFLPDNLSPMWAVVVIQYADGRITARKVGDTNPTTNSNLRNRQGFYTTAAKGSAMTIICESRNSANANTFFTIAGDVAA